MILPPDENEETKMNSSQQIWLWLFAVATSAAVFLFHFRVGIFNLLLLGVTAFFTMWKYRSREKQLLTLRSLLLTGFGILIIILPTLWDAASSYFASRLASIDTT